MIKLLTQGDYTLTETKNQTKILILDKEKVYAWVAAAEIGEILVSSQKTHPIDQILSLGKYRLYEVKNESTLTDLQHLELSVGEGQWQGYLLPTGLPDKVDTRNRIIPTKECITTSTLS